MKLTENDIKNTMYGSIRELTRNRHYFYESSFRSSWTDEGKRALMSLMDLYADKIYNAIKNADDQRAKDMVFNTLKKED
jgi:hypothetical protein